MTFVDKIPEPEDLELIGKELYGLLCVEQLPLDEAGLGKTTEKHVNMTTSGKLRLLELALNKSIKIRGLGKDKSGELDIAYLGGRRVWEAAAKDLPAKAIGQWGEGKEIETIYELAYAGEDIEEANNLLEKLGYAEPAVADKKVFGAELGRRLRRFQTLNELTITGKLDNPTLNRLMHLNFDTKSLERAKPFDAAQLPPNFDDTNNPA
jgi:IS5 family transposase